MIFTKAVGSTPQWHVVTWQVANAREENELRTVRSNGEPMLIVV